MKILMWARPDLQKAPGGDTLRILKTKEYLEKLGVEIDICLEPAPTNLEKYDLVNLFNLTREEDLFYQTKYVKEFGLPIVLNSIYWDLSYSIVNTGPAIARLVRKVAGTKLARWLYFLKKRFRDFKLARHALKLVDLVLADSEEEITLIKRDFGLKKINYQRITNGVDRDLFFKADSKDFIEKYKIKDFVLTVGRIEPRKNQARLIEALKDTSFPLVLVGRFSPDFPGYRKKVERLINQRKNTFHIGRIEHQYLPAAYAVAKVHILASWAESFGRVSFEAGLAGCNLVVTENSPWQKDFGRRVWVCSPGDLKLIRQATIQAYQAPRNQELSEYIYRNFSWKKTARETFEAYKKIIS